jgi:quercetin dioxygenase-like cupin family protein
MTDAHPGQHSEAKTAVLGPYMAQAHQHQHIQWFEGVQLRVLLDTATTGGELAVVEELSTQPYGTPLHLHPADDETLIVLQGSIRVWVGDHRHDVDDGGIAFLPRGIPHAFRVISPGARLLVLGTPSGMEELFRRAGWDLSQPLPAVWALSPDRIAEAGTSIGHRILGPPPAD